MRTKRVMRKRGGKTEEENRRNYARYWRHTGDYISSFNYPGFFKKMSSRKYRPVQNVDTMLKNVPKYDHWAYSVWKEEQNRREERVWKEEQRIKEQRIKEQRREEQEEQNREEQKRRYPPLYPPRKSPKKSGWMRFF